MINSRVVSILVVSSLASLMAACPVTLNMMVKNETEKELSVVYITGHSSQIAPGSVRKEHYNVGCIRLISEGVTHEFRADWPPNEFVKTKTFSSMVNAIFTKESQLILVQDGKQAAVFELEKGCS